MPGSDWPLSSRKNPSNVPRRREYRYEAWSDQRFSEALVGRHLDGVVAMDRFFEARAQIAGGGRGRTGVGQRVVDGRGARDPEIAGDHRERLHILEHARNVAMDVADADVDARAHLVLEPADALR